jgi:type II restriction/modification system DNA methylase subunit YeeA
LVERFAEEKVLTFKVCDPAMGSGHFLVDAANQMAGLVVALLEEVSYVEGMTISVTSRPNDWRRRITRHCLYGVDLNPLAVNLAKLSLWLNCFAIKHKLTFLDHHVRCGNSDR